MPCHAGFSPAGPGAAAAGAAACLRQRGGRPDRVCLPCGIGLDTRVWRSIDVSAGAVGIARRQLERKRLLSSAGKLEFPVWCAAVENPVLAESACDALTSLQEALEVNGRVDSGSSSSLLDHSDWSSRGADEQVGHVAAPPSAARVVEGGAGDRSGGARGGCEEADTHVAGTGSEAEDRAGTLGGCEPADADAVPSYLRRVGHGAGQATSASPQLQFVQSGINARELSESVARVAGAAVDEDGREWTQPSYSRDCEGGADGTGKLAAPALSPARAGAGAMLYRSEEESKIVGTAWEKLVRWSRSWQTLNARRESHALRTTKKVAVLGGGSFGTAMAVMLARNKTEMQVTMLLRDPEVCHAINQRHVNPRYFPRHTLPANVVATTEAREALGGAEYCIHAVPVQHSGAFLRGIAEHVPSSLPILSVSKGLELKTLEMMSQVIPRALGNPRQPVAVLSGPSFSIELMDELPTAMVAASKDKDLARAAQQLLASRYLRVSTSSDVVGVEMAGALKNVLAIAAGIVEGMNLGNNCMAALVAQGCSEIRWLAEKMGAKGATLAGLSGTGDIMLTCFVKLSRNRSVGVRLGSGEKLDDILASMSQVAEGVATAGAVIALARKYRVQMPVLTAVARILDNQLTPKTAVLALMSLPQVEEV